MTLKNKMSEKYNLLLINGDSLKNHKKQVQLCQEAIHVDDSSGIIIDNTNPQKLTRQRWMELVPDDWDKRNIYIDIPKPISFHLTNYRHFHGYNKIPSVAIHIYYKRLEIPVSDECIVSKYSYPMTSHKFNHSLRFIWR